MRNSQHGKVPVVSSFLYRVGRTCYRARGRVVAAWLGLLVLFGLLGLTIGGQFDDGFEVPGASSQVALESLQMTFPEAADASATVLITSPPGTRLTDPEVRPVVEKYLDRLEELPYVKGIQSLYMTEIEGLMTPDRTNGLTRVRVKGSASTFTDAQRADLTLQARSLEKDLPGSAVNVGGEVFSVHVPKLTLVEGLGLVVAGAVLIATLGSLVGASLPIGTAIAGVGLGVTTVQIAAGVIAVSSTTLLLAIMLALAVGIDYALFILSRHRDQLAAGMDVEESVARAVATAGSAVVFAGLTVIIALVGLGVAGLPFLTVMGVFSAVAVAFEVVLALTLLPALLGFAGERLRPRPKKPASGRFARFASWKPSAWWVAVVTRWPLVTVAVVLVALGGLSYPAKDLQLALPNSGRAEPSAPDRITFDLITERFGIGHNGPLVVTGSIVESDDPLAIMAGLKEDIEDMPGVELVAISTPNADADTGLVHIIPTTGPDDPATADLVERLRANHDDWNERYGIDTAVTGFTAVQIDVTTRLRDALLPFGIFVVGLSLVLLAMVFRSVWVPVKAALGYLLSVGGAFGATALVFNQGWFKQVINLHEAGPVISFLPIILMGILFGLAMDYEVFLVSRMREEFVHGNTERAVEDGFVHSAKVVVAAALIMFAVFAFFVPAGEGSVKPIAFGLAIGVALDAFIVRMTLVPAVMKLLGRRAWWLPGWLDRLLPSLDVEGEALAHQVKAAARPTPAEAAAIHAEGVTARAGGRTLFADLTIELPRGGVLVVEGEHVQRLALLFGLSGRVPFTAGEAKVLGHVLPEEASLVRVKAPVLQPSEPGFAAELARARGGLVLVDAADELSDAQDAALRAALVASDHGTTWVLGVMPGTDLATLVPVEHRVLVLTSHLALAGREGAL